MALLFDYDADRYWRIQPHGAGLDYFRLVFEYYRALRSLGLSIDILPPSKRDWSGYGVIAAPGLVHMAGELKQSLAAAEAQLLLGPRSAARTLDFQIPLPLPPDFPGLAVTVTRVESLPPGETLALAAGGRVQYYREFLEGTAEVVETTEDGEAAVVAAGNATYIGGWLCDEALRRVLARACAAAGIDTRELPAGVRLRDSASERFWFNYERAAQRVDGRELPPLSVTREPLD